MRSKSSTEWNQKLTIYTETDKTIVAVLFVLFS